MFNLVVRNREGVRQTVKLTARPLSVGRSETCDVVLAHDGEVSREHAQIWIDPRGQVCVADRGSKNGTRVDDAEPIYNETRVVQRCIRIGEYEIELHRSTPPALTPDEGVRFTADRPGEVENTRYFPSTHNLDLNQQRLGLLMNLTERIGGAFEPKQLLEQALDACCETLGFERGLIALKTVRGEPELPVTRNLQRDETGAYRVSRTLINRALVDGERAVVNNPALDLVDNLSESLVRFPICSALCVPILNRDRILGVIYGDRITQAAHYNSEDVDFLAAIARQVGTGLENLRLFQAYVHSERIQLELKQARSIQQNLFPANPLEHGRIVLSGHSEPSDAVGGDYFDYFNLGDEYVGLTIADVTGHGLPAALIMANLQAAVRVALTGDTPLSEVAARLNRLIYSNTGPAVFITAVFGRIHLTTGEVEYVNAGHPAPLLLRRDEVCPEGDGHCLPLGIEPDEMYSVRRIEPTRDLEGVFFYTDGLIEAADPSGRLLTLAPVRDALTTAERCTPAQVQDAALRLVRGHLGGTKNADDLTLLTLLYRNPVRDTTSPVLPS